MLREKDEVKEEIRNSKTSTEYANKCGGYKLCKVKKHIDTNMTVHFDSIWIKNIPKQALSKIKDKSISHNMFGIRSYGSIMSEFYCASFIKEWQNNT